MNVSKFPMLFSHVDSDSNPEKPAPKVQVHFILEPDRASPDGITFSWLIHHTYNSKKTAATAVRAFWLPFACQESGNYSDAELRELAQQSIWRLEEQIQHLRETFGLEAVSHPESSDTCHKR